MKDYMQTFLALVSCCAMAWVISVITTLTMVKPQTTDQCEVVLRVDGFCDRFSPDSDLRDACEVWVLNRHNRGYGPLDEQ